MRKLNATNRHTTDGRMDRLTGGGVAISAVPGPTAPAGDNNGGRPGEGGGGFLADNEDAIDTLNLMSMWWWQNCS